MKFHKTLNKAGWKLVVAAALVVAFVSVSAAKTRKAQRSAIPVSDVVFPQQQLPMRFSHVAHIRDAGAECTDCHEKALESRSSLDNLIPTEEPCRMCHAIDRAVVDKAVAQGEAPARCDACHVGFDASNKAVPRVAIPSPNLKFNHKAHADKKIACATCHGDLAAENVALATRAQLPKMGLCLECHDGNRAPSACTTCHLAEAGGFVKTTYDSGMLAPSGALRGDDHDITFRTSHRFAAQNDEGYCESCHRKEFCLDCHNGVVKPMDFHGNDYLTLHTIDARRNNPDCSACHRVATFCVGCHSRSGVVPDDKGGDFGSRDPELASFTRRFHPEGWVTFNPALEFSRGEDHHSFEAQRNIKQCAACHREDFCTGCHSADLDTTNTMSRAPVNPHPNNWVNSGRCEALAKRAGRMCLRCHIERSEVSCDR